MKEIESFRSDLKTVAEDILGFELIWHNYMGRIDLKILNCFSYFGLTDLGVYLNRFD